MTFSKPNRHIVNLEVNDHESILKLNLVIQYIKNVKMELLTFFLPALAGIYLRSTLKQVHICIYAMVCDARQALHCNKCFAPDVKATVPATISCYWYDSISWVQTSNYLCLNLPPYRWVVETVLAVKFENQGYSRFYPQQYHRNSSVYANKKGLWYVLVTCISYVVE